MLLDTSAPTNRHIPELRARSIDSLIDHRPKSTSRSTGWLYVCGEASASSANSSLTGDFITFFTSARLSAICSRMLSWGLGSGGTTSSSDGSALVLFAGDFVRDLEFGVLRFG